MENLIRRREIAEKSNPSSNQMIYEDFQPSSDWTHDSNCHLLLIDLPGFKKEEIKVEVDNLRRVITSGEKLVSKNKYSRFKEVFRVPDDSDTNKISAKLDGGVLFIIIPKNNTNETKENNDPNENKDAETEKIDAMKKKNLSQDRERVNEKKFFDVFMETGMENVSKNKVVFVSSIVMALSFGLYLSHKLGSGSQ